MREERGGAPKDSLFRREPCLRAGDAKNTSARSPAETVRLKRAQTGRRCKRRTYRLLVVFRVARIGGIGNHLLQLRAHRHVEIDALRRDGRLEPLRVDLVD